MTVQSDMINLENEVSSTTADEQTAPQQANESAIPKSSRFVTEVEKLLLIFPKL